MSEAKTVREVLIAAKWILQNRGWCQRAYARDAHGKVVSILDDNLNMERATCFCADGAVEVIKADGRLISNAIKLLTYNTGNVYQTLISWNDESGRTKEQVLELFDRTIAKVPVI